MTASENDCARLSRWPAKVAGEDWRSGFRAVETDGRAHRVTQPNRLQQQDTQALMAQALKRDGTTPCRTTLAVESANPPWNARERAIIKNMESQLVKMKRSNWDVASQRFPFSVLKTRCLSSFFLH